MNILPKWRNYALSGHTGGVTIDLETLVHALPWAMNSCLDDNKLFIGPIALRICH